MLIDDIWIDIILFNDDLKDFHRLRLVSHQLNQITRKKNARLNSWWFKQVQKLRNYNDILNSGLYKISSWEAFYKQIKPSNRLRNGVSFAGDYVDLIYRPLIYELDAHLVFKLLVINIINNKKKLPNLKARNLSNLITHERYNSNTWIGNHKYINIIHGSTANSPLFFAVGCCSLKIFEYMLSLPNVDFNIKRNGDQKTPLFVAIRYGREKIVKMILDYYWNQNNCNRTDKNQNSNKINVISLVNSCDANGLTPIYLASQYGFSSIVSILLEYGADGNIAASDGTTPLWIACRYGKFKIAKILIDSCKIIPNMYDLLYAIIQSDMDEDGEKFFRLLMNSGNCYDINHQNKYSGGSPLWMAANMGSAKYVPILIEYGAHVNQLNFKNVCH